MEQGPSPPGLRAPGIAFHKGLLLGDAFREPMTLVVAEGAVVILGPNGLSGALTPEAAEESARRLLAAAEEARSFAPPSSED